MKLTKNKRTFKKQTAIDNEKLLKRKKNLLYQLKLMTMFEGFRNIDFDISNKKY